MCDAGMLFEYGLVGAFDTIAMMRGEEVAIANSRLLVEDMEVDDEIDNNEDEFEIQDDSQESSLFEFAGITYLDVQFNSEQIAALLYHRYNVRVRDRVIILCHGNVGAELASTIGCARIGAAFVPVDDQWLHHGGNRLESIIKDCSPAAAIVVGRNDKDASVRALASLNIFRCILLNEDGSIVIEEASTADYRQDLPPSPFVLNDEDNVINRPETFPPLYILYTSGSTGVPKGVLGSHWGLINRIAWQHERFPWQPNEVACRRTPLTFVDALVEMFAPLLAAIPLWCPPHDILAGGLLAFAPVAASMRVSRLTLLPSQLLKALQLHPSFGSVASWPTLKYIHVSGEPCSVALVSLVAQYMPNVVLINLYGSTEVAGDVLYAVLTNPSSCGGSNNGECIVDSDDGDDDNDDDDDDDVLRPVEGDVFLELNSDINSVFAPVGVAILNNSLIIATCIDSKESEPTRLCFHLCEDGNSGELLVAGHHVAHGYYNRELETQTRFIAADNVSFFASSQLLPSLGYPDANYNHNNLFPGIKTLFRTGDVVVRDAQTKAITWVGRTDHQIKIHGIRAELEDIQMTMCQAVNNFSGVAVIAVNLDAIDEIHTNDNLSIVLFVEESVNSQYLQDSASRPTVMSSLFHHLQDKVPAPFLPALILPVPSIARTIAGKIDRPALKSVLHDFLAAKVAGTGDGNTSIESAMSESDADLPKANAAIRSLLSLVRDTIPACGSMNDAQLQALSGKRVAEIGADSMKRIEILWRIKLLFGVDLRMRQLIDSSIDAIASIIDRGSADNLQKASTLEDHSMQTEIASIGEIQKQSQQTQQTSMLQPNFLPVEFRCIRVDGKYAKHHLQQRTSQMGCPASASDVDVSQDAPPLCMMLTEKWSAGLQRCVDSSAVCLLFENADNVCRSLVVIGSHGGDLVAVDGESGATVWVAQLLGHIEAGATASPCGEKLLVCSYIGQDVDGHGAADVGDVGRVWCLHARYGEVAWAASLPGETKASPVLTPAGEHVLVGCYDGHCYVLNVQSGEIVNRIDCHGPIFAAPTIVASEDALLITTIKGLVHKVALSRALVCSASECIDWTMDVGSPIFSSLLPLPGLHSSEGASVSTPCTEASATAKRLKTASVAGCDGRRLMFGCVDGVCRCISSTSGEVVWASEATKPIFSTPVCASGLGTGEGAVIFGSHDGWLRCVDAIDGSLIWEVDCGSAIFTSPCLASLSRSPSVKDIVVAATTAGRIHAINSSTGKVVDTLILPGEIFSTPIVASGCGGRMFVGCRDDKLHAIDIV